MESVVVSSPGTFLGKTSERLVVRGRLPLIEVLESENQLSLPLGLAARLPLTVVTSQGERSPAPPLRRQSKNGTARKKPEQLELPLFRISEIVIAASGVTMSTDLIEACCERGIRVAFLTSTGQPFAMLSSPMLTATVHTRREQMAAYGDSRGVELTRAIVRGKLGNQAALLKYFAKYQKTTDTETFSQLSAAAGGIAMLRREAEVVTADHVDQVRSRFLAIEGAAARHYWSGVRALLDGRTKFESREHRGATDPLNSALNYGYGILYAQVWGAVMNAGLEPFAGFLHVDRPGKPSLVLDLVEEFRQPIVDRAVFATFSRGTDIPIIGGRLTEPARRTVANAVVERLETDVAFRGRRHRIKSIIQMQARTVATFLRGGGTYRPFAFKW